MTPIAQLEKGLDEDHYHIVSESPLIMIEALNGFNQLYYFLETDDLSVLDEFNTDLLTIFDPLYADITLKTFFQFEGSVFEKLGFKPFRKYVRKSVLNSDMEIRRFVDTEFAVFEDLHDILKILNDQFDLMADHIPDEAEISELIKNQQVLVIKINDTLAGTLLFEDTGKRSYARALCVAPDFQNSIVGYSLLADYFFRHDTAKTRLFYLWVDEANINVKKLHDRFGYRYDGLNNFIFKR